MNRTAKWGDGSWVSVRLETTSTPTSEIPFQNKCKISISFLSVTVMPLIVSVLEHRIFFQDLLFGTNYYTIKIHINVNMSKNKIKTKIFK